MRVFCQKNQKSCLKVILINHKTIKPLPEKFVSKEKLDLLEKIKSLNMMLSLPKSE